MKYHMRILSTLIILFALCFAVEAQMNPVKWKVNVEKVALEKYKLVINAHMEGGWVVYSQFTPDGGPIATDIEFSDSEGIVFDGKVIEPEPLKEHDPFFDLEVWKFKKNVNFQQFFTKKSEKAVIHGHINFMTCDGMRCLPPTTKDFTVYVD
jgi:thiol:disulfide interchange protein DsbD